MQNAKMFFIGFIVGILFNTFCTVALYIAYKRRIRGTDADNRTVGERLDDCHRTVSELGNEIGEVRGEVQETRERLGEDRKGLSRAKEILDKARNRSSGNS